MSLKRKLLSLGLLSAFLVGFMGMLTNTAWATVRQGPTGTWCPAGGQICAAQFGAVEGAIINGVYRVRGIERAWCYIPGQPNYRSCYALDIPGVGVRNSANQLIVDFHNRARCNFAESLPCPANYVQVTSSVNSGTGWGAPIGGDAKYSSWAGSSANLPVLIRPNFSPSGAWTGRPTSGLQQL